MALSMMIPPATARAARCGCNTGTLVSVGPYGVRCMRKVRGRFRFVTDTKARTCAASVTSRSKPKRKSKGKKRRGK